MPRVRWCDLDVTACSQSACQRCDIDIGLEIFGGEQTRRASTVGGGCVERRQPSHAMRLVQVDLGRPAPKQLAAAICSQQDPPRRVGGRRHSPLFDKIDEHAEVLEVLLEVDCFRSVGGEAEIELRRRVPASHTGVVKELLEGRPRPASRSWCRPG